MNGGMCGVYGMVECVVGCVWWGVCGGVGISGGDKGFSECLLCC